MRPNPQLLHQPLPVEVMTVTHEPILGTRLLPWPDEAACQAAAARLALSPALADATIELIGPLGAGKTTFVRHLLRALGIEGRIKSPSYAVVETYAARGFEVAHFDFYRFEDPHEWVDAGLRELYLRPGLKLVEWPERARALLPVPDLRLTIETLPDEARRVAVQPFGDCGAALAAALCG